MQPVEGDVLCPECGQWVSERSYPEHRAAHDASAGGRSTASPRGRRKLVYWLLFVLALAGLAYSARLTDADTPDDLAYRYSSSVAAVIQYSLMLGILLLIARGIPLREAFGLRRPDSWRRALGLAGACLVAIWAASAALAPFLDASDEQGLVPDEWDSSRVGAFAAFFVVVAVVAPVVEELTYRGLGFTLLAPYGAWVAILVTGVLFGAAHGLVAGLAVLSIFGVVVAWLRSRTDSVYPPMLLHGVFNGTALILSVTVAA
jgi:membrane protease YdiL (CAAX protease family)